MAYERLYGPIGPVRGDHHAALIAATIAAVNSDPKKPAPSPADFMPDWEETARGDGP